MTAKLERAIKREVVLHGTPYTVTISTDGVTIVPKGKRKGHSITWESLARGDYELTRDLKMSVDAFTPPSDVRR